MSTLSQEEITAIREALLIGVAAYGEFLSKEAVYREAAASGQPWPSEARPNDPSGMPNTSEKFARALLILDRLERAERTAG